MTEDIMKPIESIFGQVGNVLQKGFSDEKIPSKLELHWLASKCLGDCRHNHLWESIKRCNVFGIPSIQILCRRCKNQNIVSEDLFLRGKDEFNLLEPYYIECKQQSSTKVN